MTKILRKCPKFWKKWLIFKKNVNILKNFVKKEPIFKKKFLPDFALNFLVRVSLKTKTELHKSYHKQGSHTTFIFYTFSLQRSPLQHRLPWPFGTGRRAPNSVHPVHIRWLGGPRQPDLLPTTLILILRSWKIIKTIISRKKTDRATRELFL